MLGGQLVAAFVNMNKSKARALRPHVRVVLRQVLNLTIHADSADPTTGLCVSDSEM